MKKKIKYLMLTVFIAVIGFSIVLFNCIAANSSQGISNEVVLVDIEPKDIGPAAFSEPQPFKDISAVELVSDIKIGWNLGNTLDANGGSPSSSVTQLETLWVRHVTNNENIRTLRRAGFNTIRIPVSWAKTTTSSADYKIPDAWMARVTEIVNYAVAYDMYVVLNTHHDENIFKFMNADVNAGLDAFQKIWKQIAENFKNYNEKLIFEALNEPRTKGSSREWNGGTSEEHNNLNKYYAAFIDVVRKSGGNNGKRFLMINTYAASVESSAMNGLVLPTDSANKKLIVSYHSYAPYDFALNTDKSFKSWHKNNPSDTSPIINGVDRAYNIFVSKGIPVILGEFGAMDKNNEETRAQWAEFYTGYARSKGIPCIWWDNAGFTGNGELFGLINRTNNTFPFPLVLNALLRGAGIL